MYKHSPSSKEGERGLFIFDSDSLDEKLSSGGEEGRHASTPLLQSQCSQCCNHLAL